MIFFNVLCIYIILRIQFQDAVSDVPQSRMGRFGGAKLEARKRQATVDAVESMSRCLDEVFALGYNIRTVLLLLGPTIVSPKEIYEIRLPVDYHDGKILTLQKCQNQLFSHLISSDILADVSDLQSIMKLTVMIEAPEDCDFGGTQLWTKPMYKIPKHGHHFVIDIKCNADVFSTDLSQVYDTSFNISGIDILEKSVNDCSRVTANGTGDDSSPVLLKDVLCGRVGEPLRHSSEVEPLEQPSSPRPAPLPSSSALYLWYQVPITVMGFKEKNSGAS